MTTMRRVRVTWDGLGGLPGVSTFYMGVASPNVGVIKTFFNSVRGLFPTGLTWTIPASGDEIDDATGTLTGGWSGTGGGTETANGGTTSYAAGVGALVTWDTNVISRGRRVRGRTFMAPMLGAAFDTNGTIGSTQLGTLQAAASALAASGVAQGIWQRPTPTQPGLYCAINSALVQDRVTSLRSRRT